MLKKVLLIFNTVRFLKGRQLFYRLFYCLKPCKGLDTYRSRVPRRVTFSFLNFGQKYPTGEFVTPAGVFIFLNLEKDFEKNIDWDYQQYGKLWNYNLQYFNCLRHDSLPDEIKLAWLIDLGAWLRKGKLKLEPYPVSLRIMNVIRYFSERQISDKEIIKDVYAQLDYLAKHIEYHLLGNHLLENGFALMMGSCFFEHASWKEKAKKIIYEELHEQILNDGAHFELSPMYHQIILFRVLELISWYENTPDADTKFLTFVKEKASLMLGWLKKITFKNGDIPHFNDSTDGIALTSLELFSFARKLEIIAYETRINDSGYRKYVNDTYECVIDAAPIGASYQPGHAHSDALSFILYYKDKPVFVEAGTSTYQIGEKRSYERSTNAHNTVELAGISQSEVWGGFRVGRRAGVTIQSETPNAITAQHDGYLKTLGAIHKRSFNFTAGKILVRDSVSADLRSTALFHIYPSFTVEITAENKISIENTALMNFKGADNVKLLPYQFAAGYNKYSDGFCICVEFKHELQTEIVFA